MDILQLISSNLNIVLGVVGFIFAWFCPSPTQIFKNIIKVPIHNLLNFSQNAITGILIKIKINEDFKNFCLGLFLKSEKEFKQYLDSENGKMKMNFVVNKICEKLPSYSRKYVEVLAQTIYEDFKERL